MMEFLERNEICAWADAHGLAYAEGRDLRLAERPVVHYALYTHAPRSGEEAGAAADLVTRLGEWEECLVVITLWSVWPSSEDWPAFYAWRGARGERRALDVAPGHLLARNERVRLIELLTLVMENAWDAYALPSSHGQMTALHAKISHDEWYEIRDASGAAG
jgi:hypothetical protein